MVLNKAPYVYMLCIINLSPSLLFLADSGCRSRYVSPLSKHQKQNHTATSQWPVGFVFGVQLDYSCRLKSVLSEGRNRV